MSNQIWAMIVAICVAPFCAVAEQNRLQPDFTFKRVKPPSQGHQGPRITVQITPKAPVQPAPQAAPGATPSKDWFWSKVPADLAAAGPKRLQDALSVIATAPEARQIPVPRLQQLQDIARRHGKTMLIESIGTGISPALALAVVSVESAGNAEAVSSAGAVGLMQLMPATADRFGVTDRSDPQQSLKGGIAYLQVLQKEFGGDMILALAAYNAGEGAVRSAGGVPDYPETRAYIPKVLAAWSVARGLCQTPPQLMSDGCVFVGQ